MGWPLTSPEDAMKYEIGGTTYRMDELVLDQEEALAELLQPLYSGTELTAQGLVDALLRQRLLRKALAIVLVPEGQSIEAVDRDAVAAHLGRHLSLSQQAQIVRDFFGVNARALDDLRGLAATAAKAREGSMS
jgi:hypothetical protein